MKKLSTILFVLLIGCCCLLAGCAPKLSLPTNYQSVTSNGGFVVTAGNYMYFANAYQSYTNLNTKSDNEGNGVKQYALNRVEYNLTNTNKKELKKVDEQVQFENVCNKIAAYEKANMFVVNDYLYFTTPNVHKNDSKDEDDYGKYQFELSSLFRIKLDGSNFKEIYTTDSSSAKFCLTGGDNQKVLIFDDGKLKSVDVQKNATEVKTLLKDVKDVAFPKALGTEMVNLYYTIDRDDAFKGNILKSYNLVTGEEKELKGYGKNGENITLIAFDGTNLFYTRTGGDFDALYSNDFSNGSNSEKLHKYAVSGFSNSSVILTINSTEYDVNSFVFVDSGYIYVQNMNAGNDATAKKLTEESSTPVFADQTYVYYTTSSGIYRVSVLTGKKQTVSDMSNFEKSLIDFDGTYVYFYAEVEDAESGTKYLHRADISACDDEGTTKVECVAKLLDEDVKEEESKN